MSNPFDHCQTSAGHVKHCPHNIERLNEQEEYRIYPFGEEPRERIRDYPHLRNILDECYMKETTEFYCEFMRTSLADYAVNRMIGSGRYSLIFQIQFKSKPEKLLCAKLMDSRFMPDELRCRIEMNELEFMKNHITSPFLLESLVFGRGLTLWIILSDYAELNLRSWALVSQNYFPQHLAHYISCSIVNGLSYIHGKSMVHRDLRAADILLFNNGNVKICDFSHMTYVIPNHHIERTTDDLQYMSPEYFFNPRACPYKADMFALGVILYIVHFKKYPFGRAPALNNNAEKQLFWQRIKNKEIYFLPLAREFNMQTLIKHLLDPDPEIRFNIAQTVYSQYIFAGY